MTEGEALKAVIVRKFVEFQTYDLESFLLFKCLLTNTTTFMFMGS